MKALLVLVSGPPASGRSALAGRIAKELGVPLITRDSIRAGMTETQAGWSATPGAALVTRATAMWRQVLVGLLEAGVTVVAEHPLRSEVTKADLEPLVHLCRVRLVVCRLNPADAPPPPPRETVARPMRTGGMIFERPADRLGPRAPEPPGPKSALGIPVLAVEPSARGYKPPMADIIWFVRQRH